VRPSRAPTRAAPGPGPVTLRATHKDDRRRDAGYGSLEGGAVALYGLIRVAALTHASVRSTGRSP
jgi:hypothetical protein